MSTRRKSAIIKITDLKPHPKNPNSHNEKSIQAIINSYKEFGELTPIIVWGKHNIVIAGNGRLEAAKQMGWKSMRCIRADDLSKNQADAFAIADNRTAELSNWEKSILGELVQDISKSKVNLEATGFNAMELEPLMTAGLPDAPSGFGDNELPDELKEIGLSGEDSSFGRFVLVYRDENELKVLCDTLGIDGTRTVYKAEDMENLNFSKKASKKRKVKRRVS